MTLRSEPRALLDRAASVLPVGAWDWNIRTGDLFWDADMHAILGTSPALFDERIQSWRDLIHPEDLPAVLAQAEHSLREGADYHARHRVRRPDGEVIAVEVRGRVIFDTDDTPTHMAGRLWETTAAIDSMDAAARALRHMSDGFLALDDEWRILYANVPAQSLLDTPHGLIGRSLWELEAARFPALKSRCQQVVAERTPSGLDIPLSSGRWCHLRLIPVPDGLTIYLTDITDERLRERERVAAQQAEAERVKRLGELTAALSEALTAEDVVAVAVDRVLPLFGASGLILWVPEDDRTLSIAAVGYPEDFLERVNRVFKPAAGPADQVLLDRIPRFMSSPEEIEAHYPGSRPLVAVSGKQAWAFLPLLVSGRAVGVGVVSFDEPRVLVAEERSLLIAISGLIAQALERARVYDFEHSRAQALQRGLLPTALPQLPAVSAAARYLPATDGLLGGDWYDIIPLSADRVALVIGDVMGHGLPEAATMGRLRTAVQTLASLELPTDELFYRLNSIVSELGDDFYATCLYAVYDPASGLCTFANAGHPPAAVLRPDGTAYFPDQATNPPLGAGSAPFETTEVELPEGSLLVLYTDGLVESVGRDMDSGLTEMIEALTARPPANRGGEDDVASLDERCDTLVSALLPVQQGTQDDAALLIARTRLLGPRNVTSWVLSDGPVAAGEARRHIERQLADWQLADLTPITQLVVSELVGNVVRHAKGPAKLRLLRSWTLICEVSDESLTTPQVRQAREMDESGRGLQLVGALAQRWGVRYTPEGKCIWAEQLLPLEPSDSPTRGR